MIRNNPWIQFLEMLIALLRSMVKVLATPAAIVIWIWVALVSTTQKPFETEIGDDEDV